MKRAQKAGGIILLLLVAALIWRLRPSPPDTPPPRDPDRPLQVAHSGYIGSGTCRECHPKQHQTWHRSYHRTMTQVASPASVQGDFNDVQLERFNLSFNLQRRDDQFWIDMPAAVLDPRAGASRIERQIVQVTGSHHMQVYWYPAGQARRLVQFPFNWLRQEQRWIPNAYSFLRPPELEALPTPGDWNYTCLRCHATGVQPEYVWRDEDPATQEAREVHTDVAEFGISCEACHGPAETHVLAHSDRQAMGDEADLIIPDQLDPERSSQVCGQCHSVWEFADTAEFVHWSQHGFRFRPGDELRKTGRTILRKGTSDPHVMELLEQLGADTVLWSDGMVRVSGREYNGLIESPCFTHGNPAEQISCFSCHTMHAADIPEDEWDQWADDQLKPAMRTDAACTQCHSEFLDTDRLTSHTHHAAPSAGSRCYNCHMPYTTYGLLKAIRSHHIDSPGVDTSRATGRPNACNQCHLDQTLAWTADHLKNWYGIESAELADVEKTVAASVLWSLSGDAGQRALMAWSMGWPSAREASGTDWMTPYLVQLMGDNYHAVRIIAERSFRQQAAFSDLGIDPVAPAIERGNALAQVVSRYLQLVQAGELTIPRSSAQVLMSADGMIMESEFSALTAARDVRPVNLGE